MSFHESGSEQGNSSLKPAGFGSLFKGLGTGIRKGNRTPSSAGFIKDRTFFEAAEQVAKGKSNAADVIRRGEAFRTQRQLDEQDVMVLGSRNEKKPLQSFKEYPFHPDLLENIVNTFPDGPTVVQSYAIPYIIDESAGDILLRSHTGSGKTAAFMIPIINNVAKWKRENKVPPLCPQAVILVPTRELAIQVAKEGSRLSKGTGIHICFLIGSICMSDCRINIEKHGCDIVVGTIGKVKQFFLENESSKEGSKPFLSPNYIRYLVLDEADRLLGTDESRIVIDQIKGSLSLHINFQVIMNSATLSVDEYDDYLLFMPTAITVGRNMPVDTVVQRFVNVSEHQPKNVSTEFRLAQPGIVWRVYKIDFLLELCKVWAVRSESFPKVIIFVNTKRRSEFVAATLLQRGFRALAMNGDHSLSQREETVMFLKEDKIDIIVGTDVVSRGLNVPNVDVVVNYDMPVRRMEEYIHRIGRTGRMGNIGRAISFYDPNTDFPVAQLVEKVLLNTNQKIPEYLSYTIATQCDTFLSQVMSWGCERPSNTLLGSDHMSSWKFIADEAVVEFI